MINRRSTGDFAALRAPYTLRYRGPGGEARMTRRPNSQQLAKVCKVNEAKLAVMLR
jgi:hypothetical protein